MLLIPEKTSYSVLKDTSLQKIVAYINEVWAPRTGYVTSLEVEGSFIKAHYKRGAIKYFKHVLEDTEDFRRIAEQDPQLVIDMLDLPLELHNDSRKIVFETGSAGLKIFNDMVASRYKV